MNNGKQLSSTDVAKLVSIDEPIVKQALDELVSHGVCSIRDDDTIYSRRMVRDERIRQARTRAGRKGGRASAASKRQAKAQANSTPSSPTPSSTPSPQMKNMAAKAAPAAEPPYQEIQNRWNEMATKLNLPQCRTIKSRRQAITARWKDTDWRENWRKALSKIADSPFLTGQTKEQYRATLDWFTRPGKVNSLLEGAYDGKPKKTARWFDSAAEQRGKFDGIGRKIQVDAPAGDPETVSEGKA